MNSHQPLRSSSSPTSAGMIMPAPRPSSPNNTSTPARVSPDHSSSPRTPSPLNPHSQSPSPSPQPTPTSSNSLFPTPPPPPGPTRLLSFAGRDPSPVRDALIPISRAISAPSAVPPTSTLPVVVSSSPPAPSIVFGSPGSTTSSLFHARSPSHHQSLGREPEESTTTPASTWWSHKLHPPRPWAEPSKRKRTVPSEQGEAYVHTRSVRHQSCFHSQLSLTLPML
jgi:abelson tyrosine-protein kinase 1